MDLAQGSSRTLAAVVLATFILLPTIACGGEEALKATSSPVTYSASSPGVSATPPPVPSQTMATVDLANYMFTPNVLEVEAGKTTRFLALGDGEPHTFTVPELGVDIPIPGSKTTTLIEFVAPSGTTGDLELVCTFHKVLNMVGTIRVR